MISNSRIHSSGTFYIRKSAPRPLFNIEERELKYNVKLIVGKAYRQIKSYRRRADFQLQMRSVYTRLTNIVILDEILFKSFNLSRILIQKRDQAYE